MQDLDRKQAVGFYSWGASLLEPRVHLPAAKRCASGFQSMSISEVWLHPRGSQLGECPLFTLI